MEVWPNYEADEIPEALLLDFVKVLPIVKNTGENGWNIVVSQLSFHGSLAPFLHWLFS